MTVARDYFRSQSGVLKSQYEASLTSHAGDTGTNREEVLASWLQKHLPRATSPETGGQIIDSDGHVTPQIDIVIYNDNAPRFGGNPKSYYFAEGVISAIQVKSKLTSAQLTSAVNNLDAVKTCTIRPSSGLILGTPSEEILTGIFAFELDSGDFPSNQSLIDSLKRRESRGKKPVDFVCVNQKIYIPHNKGEWHSNNAQGERTLLPSGYIEGDASEECIFRMVLTLSSEAKKNIASAVDFQPYFIGNW